MCCFVLCAINVCGANCETVRTTNRWDKDGSEIAHDYAFLTDMLTLVITYKTPCRTQGNHTADKNTE